MKRNDLLQKIAKLESMNDQLEAEISYLETLTKSLGFVNGLETLKAAALEMLEEAPQTEDGASPPRPPSTDK